MDDSSAPASSCRITSTSTPPPTACACSRFAAPRRRPSPGAPPPGAAHRRAREPAAAELRLKLGAQVVERAARCRRGRGCGALLLLGGAHPHRAPPQLAVLEAQLARGRRAQRRVGVGVAAAGAPRQLAHLLLEVGERAAARAFAGDLLGERERVGRCGDDSCSTPATISHATAGPVSRSCFIVRASTTARSTFAFRRHDSHRVWSGFSRSKRFEHDAQNALCVVAYTCSSEGLTLTRTRRLDGGVASGARRGRCRRRWRWRSGMSSEIALFRLPATELRCVANVDGSQNSAKRCRYTSSCECTGVNALF